MFDVPPPLASKGIAAYKGTCGGARPRPTRDELRTWYEAKLPTARRVTDDDGYLVFPVVPEGAGPREVMGVLIEGDGKYRVFELTRQKQAGT